MSGRRPNVEYVMRCSTSGPVCGIQCTGACGVKEGLQRWSLRENPIIIFFLYRTVTGITCTRYVGS